MNTLKSQAVVEVTHDELPMHCPAPASALWDSHPRVYIPLEDAPADNPQASCAYCGTVYKLVDSKNGLAGQAD